MVNMIEEAKHNETYGAEHMRIIRKIVGAVPGFKAAENSNPTDFGREFARELQRKHLQF